MRRRYLLILFAFLVPLSYTYAQDTGIWTYPVNAYSPPNDLLFCRDGGYLVSGDQLNQESRYNPYLLKVTADGTYEWMVVDSFMVENEDNFIEGVAETPNGDFILAYFQGYPEEGSILVKHNSAGGIEWLTHSDEFDVSSMITNGDGNIVMAGQYRVVNNYSPGIKIIDSNGVVMDSVMLSVPAYPQVGWFSSIISDPQGGYICGGTLIEWDQYLSCLVTARYDDNLNLLWVHVEPNEGLQNGVKSVTSDQNGNIYSYGSYYRTGHSFVSIQKFSDEGDLRYLSHYNSIYRAFGSISCNPEGQNLWFQDEFTMRIIDPATGDLIHYTGFLYPYGSRVRFGQGDKAFQVLSDGILAPIYCYNVWNSQSYIGIMKLNLNADPVGNAPESEPLPATCSLYPNPFREDITIKFSSKATGLTNITIYNLKGQKVRTLQNGLLAKGDHQVIWDGINEQGHPCAAGMYFLRMNVTWGQPIIKRIVKIK